MNEKITKNIGIAIIVFLIVTVFFLVYVEKNAINHIEDVCDELEEFPQECYFEGVVSYPKEHQGDVDCICIDYAFLEKEYQYVNIEKKQTNVKNNTWFKLLMISR